MPEDDDLVKTTFPLDESTPYGSEGLIVSLDVRVEAPLGPIRRLLLEGEADGRWYFEEAAVSDAWRSA